jgi:hypothetical protein
VAALITATGLFFHALSPTGRDAQSMAFPALPGTPYLYSGVANKMASAARIFFLNSATIGGGVFAGPDSAWEFLADRVFQYLPLRERMAELRAAPDGCTNLCRKFPAMPRIFRHEFIGPGAWFDFTSRQFTFDSRVGSWHNFFCVKYRHAAGEMLALN